MTISNERIEYGYSNVAKALVLFAGNRDNGLTVTVLCKATKWRYNLFLLLKCFRICNGNKAIVT